MSQLVITISDLPPEILSEIFLLNTSVDSSYGANNVKTLQDTARYTSQVCRQWRFLVLEIPVIWSRVIDFTRGSHLWTKELLRRASDCPLTLVSRYRSLSSRILARELEHVSQFGRYDGVFTAETWPLVLDKFQQPTPYLEELRLRGSSRSSSAQYNLPATIFSGNAPRLRQLSLKHIIFDDDLPYLAQLTHLSVSQVDHPLKKWLDTLSRMTFLADLELKGVNIGTESHAAVHLPNLENITLTASLRESSAFLSSLILKPTCSIRVIALNSRPGTDFDVTAGIIAQNLQLHFINATESDFPLFLDFGNDRFCISNHVSSPTWAASEPETPPYVFFGVSWSSHPSHLLSFLPHVSSAFAGPLSQVTSLRLSLSSALAFKAHSPIANVLRQANNVTSLVRLSQQTANIFLQLDGVRRPISTQTKGDIIFPSLHTIHVAIQWYAGTNHILQSLVDFIRYRISIAGPMKEVYYANPSRITWVQNEMECLRETGVLVTQRD